MKQGILLDIIHYAKGLDDITDDEILKTCTMKGYMDCLYNYDLISHEEYWKFTEGLLVI